MKTNPVNISDYIKSHAEAFETIDQADIHPLIERIGDASVVLIGEASHGTSEFYRMRQRITRALIESKGFNIIGIEGDWPDTEHVDEYVRLRQDKHERPRQAFSRFPTWMWRNHQVLSFIEWLRSYNSRQENQKQVSVNGLDIYSLFHSIHEVIEHLDRKGEMELSKLARHRYGSLLAYEPEPQNYGSAVLMGRQNKQQDEVVAMLTDLFHKRMQVRDEERAGFFDAEQNAHVVANTERYYRVMFMGGTESWNQRDQHMFDTLQRLLCYYGSESKAVVWAHNSHVGDARATEMSARGEHNIGQLCTEQYGSDVVKIGFGTHTGTVAAAPDWGNPVEVMAVKPSQADSHESLFHKSAIPNCILPLRQARLDHIDFKIRQERAIGVIYRPQTERISHYFKASLAEQFDEYIWFDKSHAVSPLGRANAPDLPERHPFLLAD